MIRFFASRRRAGKRRATLQSLAGSGTGSGLRNSGSVVTISLFITTFITIAGVLTGCQTIRERQDVRPRVLRDVPAQRLAYRYEPDVNPPAEVLQDSTDKIEAIQQDFTSRRPNDALIRTVVSPDKQRALALYGTEDEPSSVFRIDLYAIDGRFLRNLTPPDLACVFPETVSWSSDGGLIAFVGRRNVKPTPSPTPTPDAEAETVPDAVPSPSVAPAFAPVALFNTEQIYICNRDGLDLRPLTSRDGLIYFYFAWAPDNHAVAALSCRESEWNAREQEYKLPMGRPRIVSLDGKERLLDDNLTEALPVWSPDASKVATAFGTDLAIYDAAGAPPSQARIPLRDAAVKASIAYEQKQSSAKKKADGEAPGIPDSLPASFNPVVRLSWTSPEQLYFQTAYVRLIPNDPINTFQRWHRIILSPQAAVLK